MTSDFNVAGCRSCRHHWVCDDRRLTQQTTITCPHCETTQPTKKVKTPYSGPWETREQAAEARSRMLAEEAGKSDVYQRFVEDKGHGQYAEQGREVDRQLDAFIVDVEKMDLRPIETDRYAEAVEALDRRRERDFGVLEDEVDDRCWYTDAFADEIDLEDDYRSRIFESDVEKMLEEWGGAPDRVAPRTGEFVLDTKFPASAIADVAIDGETTMTSLWGELLERAGFKHAFVDSIRNFASGRTSLELQEALEAGGVAYDLRSAIERVARGDPKGCFSTGETTGLLDLARRLASQRAATDQILGTAGLVGWTRDADEEPSTIVCRLDKDEFSEKDRDQRENVVRLLWALSRHCEVVVVSPSPIDLRWFATDHSIDRSDFSERWTGRLVEPNLDGAVKTAVDTLDRDSTGAKILRVLHADSGESLSYHALKSALNVSTARLSQVIPSQQNGEGLVDLGLVETFKAHRQTHVELTPAGREVIETIDSKTTIQRRLDADFSELLDAAEHGREIPPAHEGGQKGDPRRKGTGLAPVGTLSRRRAFGATASARETTVSVADYPVEKSDDYRCPQLWINESGSQVVTSTEYVNPMQYWVSTARSLTDNRIFDYALTEERLESSDYDFGELFDEYRDTLRCSRCLGHLPDDLESVADYQDALQEARDHLEDLLSKLKNGEFEDESTFRGTIQSDALGLVGTIVHIMDLVDVDLVREVRLPTFSSDFDSDRWEDLTRTLAIGAAIQSSYGHSSVYRQLFETRKEKLDWTIFADVDAADPIGDLIGSFVLVGNFGGPDSEKRQDFVEDLVDELKSPSSVRDDAPELCVEIPVQAFEFERSQFVSGAGKMLREKNLQLTPEAVSLLGLFTATPYDAVDAMNGLKSDTKYHGRKIRVDEVRFALAKPSFSTDRLCPWFSRAGRDIVQTLLVADRPLSVSELSDRSSRNRSTIYEYADDLEAAGLLEITDDGWRLAVSFRDGDEQYGSDVLPWFVDESDVLLQDVLFEASEVFVDDPSRFGDAGDPICGPFLDWPLDVERLRRSWSWADSWIDPIRRAIDAPERRLDVVRFGPPIEQTALGDSTSKSRAAAA